MKRLVFVSSFFSFGLFSFLMKKPTNLLFIFSSFLRFSSSSLSFSSSISRFSSSFLRFSSFLALNLKNLFNKITTILSNLSMLLSKQFKI